MTWDSASAITFSAGWARPIEALDDTHNMRRSTTMQKVYDGGGWDEAAAGGMLPSGVTKAASLSHPVFAISKPDGTVNFGLDTRANYLTAALLLADGGVVSAGYTSARRIGWIMIDASDNIKEFTQQGDDFEFSSPTQIGNDTSTDDFSSGVDVGFNAAGQHAAFPETQCMVNIMLSTNSAVGDWYFGPKSSDPGTPTETAASNFRAAAGVFRGYIQIFAAAVTPSSGAVFCKDDGADTTTDIIIAAEGWRDYRGK
jgi:hypothetical protein